MFHLMLLAVMSSLLFMQSAAAEDETRSWPPTFEHSKVAVTLGGYHSTTRGTIRLVFPRDGGWLVFHGDPNTYHFSEDGETWTAAEAPQASRSHLIEGDTIHTFYTVLVEPAPAWVFDSFVCRGTVSGQSIRWDAPHRLDTRLSYYPDLKRDSEGHFTMTGRAVIRNEEGEVVGTEVLWKRSLRPNDISEWGPDVRCMGHTGAVFTPGDESWKVTGSTVHENLALEDGKSYVLSMMTVDGVGKLYGNLFDGRSWGEQDAELAAGMSAWAGTDRRMCAGFDKEAKVIHLAYVDAEGGLWYRSAGTPYGVDDWSEPVKLQPFKTFTTVLSLDTSHQPAHVYVLFGKTLFEDKGDLRNTYGAFYLQRFDGRAWAEPVLVSDPQTGDNWFPNMNADVRDGIGVLYLKGTGAKPPVGKPPLDIMFASTGTP